MNETDEPPADETEDRQRNETDEPKSRRLRRPRQPKSRRLRRPRRPKRLAAKTRKPRRVRPFLRCCRRCPRSSLSLAMAASAPDRTDSTERGARSRYRDNDAVKVERATETGFETIQGDGIEESVLVDAGIESADAIGGLTGDLNTNFTAA